MSLPPLCLAVSLFMIHGLFGSLVAQSNSTPMVNTDALSRETNMMDTNKVVFSFVPKPSQVAADPKTVTQLKEGWTPLLDPTMSKWELWMGIPLSSVTQLPPGIPTSTIVTKGTPLGLNNDPKHVFTVRLMDGEPLLAISGEIYGGLTTLNSYSNYHFRTQFKWGKLKWEPRVKLPRDNGILIHCSGPHGMFWNVWKRCLEFQVQEKDMGDLYCLGGTYAEAPISKLATSGSDKFDLFYDRNGVIQPVGRPFGSFRNRHLQGDFERPLGEWNTLEYYALGNSLVYVVNGHVVQVLRNLCTIDTRHQKNDRIPLDAGQIQIQCEGAEAYYRRMEISPITDFPPEIKKAIQMPLKADLLPPPVAINTTTNTASNSISITNTVPGTGKATVTAINAGCSNIAPIVSADSKSALEFDPEGWIDVMPPADLKGWTRITIPPGNPLGRAQWHLNTSGQVLSCDGDGGHEMLRYDRNQTNCIFHTEFRFLPVTSGKTNYNSGIFIRNSPQGEIWHQCQLTMEGGYLFGITPNGDKTTHFKSSASEKRMKAPGEWNTVEVTAQGNKLTVWLNGREVSRYDDCGMPAGYIGLESEGYAIEFRNLKLKELGSPNK